MTPLHYTILGCIIFGACGMLGASLWLKHHIEKHANNRPRLDT
jgi:hypothetical protein